MIYGDGKWHLDQRTGEYRKVLKRNLKEIRLPSGATCYEVKYSLSNLKTQKRYSTLDEADRFMAMCQNLLDRDRMSKRSQIDESAIIEYPETLLRDIGIRNECDGYYEFIVPEFEERFEKASETLSPREKDAIMRYYKGMKKLADVGKEMGITQERARQIITHALRKLRHQSSISALTMRKDEYYLITQAEKDKMIAEFKAKLEADFDNMTYEKALEIVREHDMAKGTDPETLEMDIAELDMAVRSTNCLRHAGIFTVGQLSELSLEKLRKIRNLGKKSEREIVGKLAEIGITLEE